MDLKENSTFKELEDSAFRIGSSLPKPNLATNIPTFSELTKIIKEQKKIAPPPVDLVANKKLSPSEEASIKQGNQRFGDVPKLDFYDKWKDIGSNPSQLIPFLSSGVEAIKFGKLLGAAHRLEKNSETDNDLKILKDYIDTAKADKTFGYKVMDVVSMIPSFAGEIWATGGIATATKTGAKKALKKILTKKTISLINKKIAKKGIGLTAEIIARSAQAPIAGATRIPAGTLEKQLHSTLRSITTDKKKENLALSATKAFGEQWVEILSEFSGGLLTGLSKYAKNGLLKTALFASFQKANPGASPSVLAKIIKKTGWNGIIGEMFEERMADVGHGLLYEVGAGDQKFKLPSAEQLAVEFVSFSVPGVAISALNRYGQDLKNIEKPVSGLTIRKEKEFSTLAKAIKEQEKPKFKMAKEPLIEEAKKYELKQIVKESENARDFFNKLLPTQRDVIRKKYTGEQIEKFEKAFKDLGGIESKKENINIVKTEKIKGAIEHRPTKTGATADNVSQEISGMGMPDFYEHPEYYDFGGKEYKESIEVLQKIRNKPEKNITIYRASPKNELRTGDWITLSKEKARKESLTENVPIQKFKVKVKDVEFAGDDITEFGYWGHPIEIKAQEIKSKAYMLDRKGQKEITGKQAVKNIKKSISGITTKKEKEFPVLAEAIKEKEKPKFKMAKEPLIEEAKKYDSVEEFIEAQPKVYHGTPEKFDVFKERTTFFTEDKNFAENVASEQTDNIINKLETETRADGSSYYPEIMERYGSLNLFNISNKNNLEKLKRLLPDKLKVTSYFGGQFDITKKEIVKALKEKNENTWTFFEGDVQHIIKKLGFDGWEMTEKGKKTIAVFSPSKLKTKSQLIDIWNKAQEIKSKAYMLDKERRKKIIGKQTVKNIKKSISGITTKKEKKFPVLAKAIKEKEKPKFKMVEKFKGFDDLTLKTIEKLKGKTKVSKQFIRDLTNAPGLKQAERDLVCRVLDDMPEDKINVKEFADKVKTELLPLKIEKTLISTKYESITLPPEQRGNIANYIEHIYESPVKTSVGKIHFPKQTKNYFAHTRVEDMADNKIRRIIELQSDLFQRGRLESEKTLLIPETIDYTTGKRVVIPQKRLDRTKEISQLQPYRNTWHERIIKEEIKKASEDGKKILQFPTGETAMKIERLGETNSYWLDLEPNDLKIGKEIVNTRNTFGDAAIYGDKWIITDVLGDGKFKAVLKNKTRGLSFDRWKKEFPNEYNNLQETFDISGKVDTSNPIYKFYEKDIQKYLKRIRPGMKRIIDKQGVEWFQIDITKEDAKQPVAAYMLDRKGQKEITGKQAVKNLDKLIKRFKLSNVDRQVVKIILTEDKEQAMASSFGTNITFTEIVAEFAAHHELGHTIFRNLKNIKLFSNKGITREGLLAEMREKYPDQTNAELEETLMEDLELYLKMRQQNKPTTFTGKIKEFFDSIWEWLKRVFENKENLSQIRSFYKTMETGKAKETTAIKATGKEKYIKGKEVVDFSKLKDISAKFKMKDIDKLKKRKKQLEEIIEDAEGITINEELELREINKQLSSIKTEKKSLVPKIKEIIKKDKALKTIKKIKPIIKEYPDKLIEQAKKYKSAEEFVETQGKPVYHGTNYANARMIQREGINPKNANAIQKWMKGKKYSFFNENEKYAQSYGIQKGGGNTKSGRSFVLAIKSPKDIQIEQSTFKKGMKFPDLISQQKISPEDIYIKGIDNKWYPIKEFNFFMGEPNTFIGRNGLKELPIKTKSQLKDIWNKAQKIKPESQISKVKEIIKKDKVLKTIKKIKPIIKEYPDKLIEQAKKYKSAEEFVEAQPKLYHQTSFDISKKIKKEGFVLGKKGSGETDILPLGINTKSTQKGLLLQKKGVQVEVFPKKDLKIKEFNNRNDVIRYLNNNSKEFYNINKKINKIDIESAKKANKLSDTFDEKNLNLAEKILNDARKKMVVLAKKAKQISSDIFKKDGYEAIKIKKDIGAFGITDNLIIFDTKNIKTESQLKDIWKKAQKIKPELQISKIKEVIKKDKKKKETAIKTIKEKFKVIKPSNLKVGNLVAIVNAKINKEGRVENIKKKDNKMVITLQDKKPLTIDITDKNLIITRDIEKRPPSLKQLAYKDKIVMPHLHPREVITSEKVLLDISMRNQARAARKATAVARKETREKFIKEIKENRISVKAAKNKIYEYAKGLPNIIKAKLLGKMKNVDTLKDVDKQVVPYIKKLTENYLRKITLQKINKLFDRIKYKKQSGRRVDKRYDADIQKVLIKISQASKITKEQAQELIDKNLEKYKDKEMPLNVASDNRILSMYSGMKKMSLVELEAVYNTISEMELNGSLIASLKQFNIKTKDLMMREKGIDRLTKKEGLAEGIEVVGAKYKYEINGGIGGIIKLTKTKEGRKKLLEAFKRKFATRFKTMIAWSNIMDILDFNDKTTKPGEGYFATEFSLTKMKGDYDAGISVKNKEIGNMYRKAYGDMKDREMVKSMNNDLEVENLGIFKTNINGKETPVDLNFSKSEARYIWAVMKDPSLRETFEKGMHYTQEIFDAIDKFLSEKDKTFATLQLKWYQDYYKKINKIYRELNGVDLPFNEFYIRIRRGDIAKETQDSFSDELSFRRSINKGSFIERKKNIKPIKIMSDITVMQTHIAEMEHYIAFGLINRKINTVFGNEQVRNAIKQELDTDILELIDKFRDVIANTGINNSRMFQRWDKLRARFVTGVLAVRPTIAIKQMVSIVAYADSIPLKDFMKGFSEAIAHPLETYKFLKKHSKFFRHRGENTERDIKIANQLGQFTALRKNLTWINMLMLNVKGGDKFPILFGGYSIYKYYYNNAIKAGKSIDEAVKIGIDKFETISYETQQSSAVSDLSMWQQGSPLEKLFTTFLSSPNLYFRKVIGAIRNLSVGRGDKMQHAKTIAIYWFVLPIIFQWISDFGRWDEKEQQRAILLGPLNGMFLIGDGLEFILREVMRLDMFNEKGEKKIAHFGQNEIYQTVFSDITKLINSSAKMVEDPDAEDVLKAIKDLSKVTGTATGLPLKYSFDLTQGMSNIIKGEYTKGIGEIVGWSEYTLKQKEAANKRKEIQKRKEKRRKEILGL